MAAVSGFSAIYRAGIFVIEERKTGGKAMGQKSEFPQVSEFLEKMQIKKSMFGYDKEDVYLKMQQLNRLYQEQLFWIKGQVEAARTEAEQMRREAEEIREKALKQAEQMRQETLKEAEQMRQEAAEEAERLKTEARQKIEEMKEQIRETERASLARELEEKNSVLRKELGLLEEEMNRSVVQLNGLRDRVNRMTENL